MENKNQKNKIDSFLVQTFKGLISFCLSLMGLILIIILPMVLIPLSIFLIISGDLLKGLECLFFSVVSFYTARGLTAVLEDVKY